MLGVVVLTIAVTMWRYGAVSKGFFPQQDTGLLVGTSEGRRIFLSTPCGACRTGLATSSSPIPGWSPSPPSSVRPMAALSRIAAGFFIALKPLSQRAGSEEIIQRLRRQTSAVPGISLFLTSNQDIRMGGRTPKAQYQYSLQSGNLDE